MDKKKDEEQPPKWSWMGTGILDKAKKMLRGRNLETRITKCTEVDGGKWDYENSKCILPGSESE